MILLYLRSVLEGCGSTECSMKTIFTDVYSLSQKLILSYLMFQREHLRDFSNLSIDKKTQYEESDITSV